MKRNISSRDFKAVIFDMDGVIVDSMPYHFISWHEALRAFGARVNAIDVYSNEGVKWQKALKLFLAAAKVKPTKKLMDRIFKKHKEIFKKTFKRHIFVGAKELISKVKKKKFKTALVTGTNLKRVKQILPKKIFDSFDAIVSGDDVKKGKPHPEPYLKAAKMLKLMPCECLVIENAPFGIESAKKAGMKCIAVTTSLPKEYLRGADSVFDGLKDIIEIFL